MPASLFKTIVGSIDLTSLEGNESEATIQALVENANAGVGGARVAAVCVYPKYYRPVISNLLPEIKTALVAPGFPTGIFTEAETATFFTNCKLAQEIDVVINPTLAKNESWHEYAEIVSFWRKQTIGKTLKVIIESGELNADQIERATQIVADSGADFVKTSTGKTKTGFTKGALMIMCKVAKTHFEKTGKRLGIKVSGGIKTYDQVVEIVGIISEKLGNEWLVPQTFRIGASSLYNTLKQHGGN